MKQATTLRKKIQKRLGGMAGDMPGWLGSINDAVNSIARDEDEKIARRDLAFHLALHKSLQGVEALSPVRPHAHSTERADHARLLQRSAASSKLRPSIRVPAGPCMVTSPSGSGFSAMTFTRRKLDAAFSRSPQCERQNCTDAQDCGRSALAVADMNQDGFDDFAMDCESPNTIRIYRGASVLPEQLAIVLAPPGNATSDPAIDVAFGDLDGDGYPDLLTSWGAFFVGGKELPEQSVSLPWIGRRNYVTLGDHNADGLMDFAMSSTNSGSSFWAQGNGTLYPLADPNESASVLTIDEAPLGLALGR